MEFKMNENGFETEFEFGKLNISSNDEHGFRPYSLMVSSIAGCSGSVLRKVLNKMRIDFNDINITADVKRNPDAADRIEEVHMHFTVFGENISDKKLEKALELTKKNCSMVQSVLDSIKITETYEIKA